jgi:hypothetical protein
MIVLRLPPESDRDTLDLLKLMSRRFPGPHALMILVGGRALTFGPQWRFDRCDACLSALSEFGTVEEPSTSDSEC